MHEVQKKIVLSKICQMLLAGERTRTHLRRYSGFHENDVECSIEFGASIGCIEILPRGYVQLSEESHGILEVDYYPCIEEMLKNYYQELVSPDGRFFVSKTARRDSKIAGRWTRPDFTILTSRKFPYINQLEFDIITFEIKRPADCEALAVFEALAHNSAATRSYVFFPITESELISNPQGERIKEECVRHGIGLFLVSDSYHLDETKILIESQRRPLNPEKCSQFLQNVLEPSELSRLTTWN